MADESRRRGSSEGTSPADVHLPVDKHHFIGIHRDADSSEERQPSETPFYRRVFDQSPAPMLVLKPDFSVWDANIAAHRLLGRELGELRSIHFESHIGSSDQRAFVDIRRDLLERGKALVRPLLLRRADDSELEVSLTALVCRTERGDAEFVLVVIADAGKAISEDLL